MTTLAPSRPASLPAGAVALIHHGLLSHVSRPCPDHGGESQCVARDQVHSCLVYWCGRAEHHFITR